MITDDLGKSLHYKAARGEVLSDAEQAQLEQWYARQDLQESTMLELAAPTETLTKLREQVDGALAELLAVTQSIQVLAAENEVLRNELVVLRRQLTPFLTSQSV